MTARASAWRPLRTRYIGDSGIQNRRKNPISAGIAATRKIQRHGATAPMLAAAQAVRATTMVPTAQNPSSQTSQRPRFLGGRNSAIIA